MPQAYLIEPSAEISIPGLPFIRAAFGRDGDTIIVLSNVQAIDFFALGVHFWPEILGAITLVLVIWAALRFWHAAQTPRLPGQPHCRRCDYCLAGSPEDRCPECGTRPSVRRPIIGRRLARRTGMLLSVAATATALYSGLWLFQAPRSGWVGGLFPLWNTSWVNAANQSNSTAMDRFILRYSVPTFRLAEYDAATGKLRREIAHVPGFPARNALAVSKSGDWIWLTSGRMNKLTVISTASGRILHEFDLPDTVGAGSSWSWIAGVRPDGVSAIAAIYDTIRDKVVVVSADRLTGRVRKLFETDVGQVVGGGLQHPIAGEFFLVPDDKRIRMIETRFASISNWDKPNSSRTITRVLLHEIQGDVVATREFPDKFTNHQTPGFTADGRFLFMPAALEAFGPVRWDLETLEPVGFRRVATSMPADSASGADNKSRYVPDSGNAADGIRIVSDLAYCPVQDRLYGMIRVKEDGGRLHIGVFDGATLERLDACPYTRQPSFPEGVQVSPDGRRLLIYDAQLSATPNAADNRLILFDLR